MLTIFHLRRNLPVVVGRSSPTSNQFRSSSVFALQSCLISSQSSYQNNTNRNLFKLIVTAASGIILTSYSFSETMNESENNNKPTLKKFPIISSKEVSKHDGKSKESNGKSWVTVGNNVYDITEFIQSHPGGSDKIKLASGGPVEPFWSLFPFHYDLELVQDILKTLQIGILDPIDIEKKEKEKLLKSSNENDKFASDPIRHPALKLHSSKPCNAEVPDALLTESYITPAELFFIRHHHPVPMIKDIKEFRLKINGEESSIGNKEKIELSMEELAKLPQHEITATIQCSGNRRSGMNDVKKTSGSPWVQGAISTAKWKGPKLIDVLKLLSPYKNNHNSSSSFTQNLINDKNIEHVIFKGIDGMEASIPKYKALSELGDVILATHMNDVPIPAEHGYPLRAIVPGHVGVRNVKWVHSIVLSKEEAKGDWQRGLNYKVLPPGALNASGIDISKLPAMQESSVFSGITHIENNEDNNTIDCHGWAFAGGGRGIARVDISTDNGKTWCVSEVNQGHQQKLGQEWAWVFWEANDIPAKASNESNKDGEKEIMVISRAVDKAYNYQPENANYIWNMRGLGNNSWYRRTIPIEP